MLKALALSTRASVTSTRTDFPHSTPIHRRASVYSYQYLPGNGAKSYGVFKFSAGQKLQIAVGQSGRNPFGSVISGAGGGGGGGTFVYVNGDTEPLIVAGGGGGSSYYGVSLIYNGRPGQRQQCGTRGYNGVASGEPGCNGYGGWEGRTTSNQGAGGAGWRQTGQSSSGYPNMAGQSLTGKFAGGQARTTGYLEGELDEFRGQEALFLLSFMIIRFAFFLIPQNHQTQVALVAVVAPGLKVAAVVDTVVVAVDTGGKDGSSRLDLLGLFRLTTTSFELWLSTRPAPTRAAVVADR